MSKRKRKPLRKILRPYWTTSDGKAIRLYQGDVLDVLKRLPPKSIHTVMTSPPYWGLRDYGTDKTLEIGSEKTPEEYVQKMVQVFREVHRVLKDDGTLWLNLGDTYGGGNGNLVGIPWRVALALQADGWILRQDIIWHKPSPMPESVRNRCTKAHEYLFLLVKRSGYFYDAEAIKEKSVDPESLDGRRPRKSRKDHLHKFSPAENPFSGDRSGFLKGRSNDEGRTYPSRNKRSVWTIDDEARFLAWLLESHPEVLEDFAIQDRNKKDTWTIPPYAYSGAHFATFPPKLVLPCILAGTSEMGCCPKCGAPRRRVVEEKPLKRKRPNDYVKRTGAAGTGNSCANSVAGVDVKTVGWEATCDCRVGRSIPCTVLDPFVGSGTTCCVAATKGRRSIGIDLSEEYLENQAIPRINGTLLDIPKLAGLSNQI